MNKKHIFRLICILTTSSLVIGCSQNDGRESLFGKEELSDYNNAKLRHKPRSNPDAINYITNNLPSNRRPVSQTGSMITNKFKKLDQANYPQINIPAPPPATTGMPQAPNIGQYPNMNEVMENKYYNPQMAEPPIGMPDMKNMAPMPNMPQAPIAPMNGGMPSNMETWQQQQPNIPAWPLPQGNQIDAASVGYFNENTMGENPANPAEQYNTAPVKGLPWQQPSNPQMGNNVATDDLPWQQQAIESINNYPNVDNAMPTPDSPPIMENQQLLGVKINRQLNQSDSFISEEEEKLWLQQNNSFGTNKRNNVFQPSDALVDPIRVPTTQPKPQNNWDKPYSPNKTRRTQPESQWSPEPQTNYQRIPTDTMDPPLTVPVNNGTNIEIIPDIEEYIEYNPDAKPAGEKPSFFDRIMNILPGKQSSNSYFGEEFLVATIQLNEVPETPQQFKQGAAKNQQEINKLQSEREYLQQMRDMIHQAPNSTTPTQDGSKATPPDNSKISPYLSIYTG